MIDVKRKKIFVIVQDFCAVHDCQCECMKLDDDIPDLDWDLLDKKMAECELYLIELGLIAVLSYVFSCISHCSAKETPAVRGSALRIDKK